MDESRRISHPDPKPAAGGSGFVVQPCSPLAVCRQGLSTEAAACISALERDGQTAWAVGGCVRDMLLGRTPSDFDIATSAPVEHAVQLLESDGWAVIATGLRHGTITAVSNGTAIEVTTYRLDGTYSDGRHPDSVAFTDSIDDDLERRDFTINAMAFHPQRGFKDPFGGIADLERGIIRAVGNPQQRFNEDGLRILRCLRFASQLSFAVESETIQAARALAASTSLLSPQRVESEIRKLVCGENAGGVISEHYGIIGCTIPEIVPMAGLEQRSPYHCFDVLEHTLRTMAATPPEPDLRYAALFHDMGKPDTMTIDEQGRGHFYAHPERSEAMAAAIMDRLRFAKHESSRIRLLVRFHDASLHATERSIRRMMAQLGDDEGLLRKLIVLKRADALAHAPGHTDRAVEMDGVETLLDSMVARRQALKRRDLAICGTDLMQLGIGEGPAIGRMLASLFEDVVEERVENDRDALMEIARRKLAEESTGHAPRA